MYIMKEIKHFKECGMQDKGYAVNLYLIKKMIWKDLTIQEVEKEMQEQYKKDCEYWKHLYIKQVCTYKEYVNYQRAFIASIMGIHENF